MSGRVSLRSVATPAVIAVFAALATTGILLFFHLAERSVKELHEWLGIVFVVAASLHVARNFPAWRAHLRSKVFWGLATVVLGVAATFVVPALGAREERPQGLRLVIDAVGRAPLADVARLLECSPDELRARLQRAGIPASAEAPTLEAIAKAAGKPVRAVMEAVVASTAPEARGPTVGMVGGLPDHDPALARRLVTQEHALLLDVRSQAEWDEGHLEGAVLLPQDELEARFAQIEAATANDPDRPIVVYCRSGRRSALAKTALVAHGYTRVTDLGAMSAWCDDC
jgi:rhodanese-related sulfurtransferase